MAKKKSSSSTRDSDTPPAPADLGLPPMDGNVPPPSNGVDSFYQQHKAAVIGGGLAVLVAAAYLFIKSRNSASSTAQTGTTLPVTDILSPPSSGNMGASSPSGPGASGYGGNGSATQIENALTQLENEITQLASIAPNGTSTNPQGTTNTTSTTSQTNTNKTSPVVPASSIGAVQVANPTTALSLVGQSAPLWNNATNTSQFTTTQQLSAIANPSAAAADFASGTPVYWINPSGQLQEATYGMQTVPGDRTLYTLND